jgi:hypothetical protein
MSVTEDASMPIYQNEKLWNIWIETLVLTLLLIQAIKDVFHIVDPCARRRCRSYPLVGSTTPSRTSKSATTSSLWVTPSKASLNRALSCNIIG